MNSTEIKKATSKLKIKSLLLSALILIISLMVLKIALEDFNSPNIIVHAAEDIARILTFCAAVIISLSVFIKTKGNALNDYLQTYQQKLYARFLAFILGLISYYLSNDFTYCLAVGLICLLIMAFDFPSSKKVEKTVSN